MRRAEEDKISIINERWREIERSREKNIDRMKRKKR
jgi:hypothetical protein